MLIRRMLPVISTASRSLTRPLVTWVIPSSTSSDEPINHFSVPLKRSTRNSEDLPIRSSLLETSQIQLAKRLTAAGVGSFEEMHDLVLYMDLPKVKTLNLLMEHILHTNISMKHSPRLLNCTAKQLELIYSLSCDLYTAGGVFRNTLYPFFIDRLEKVSDSDMDLFLTRMDEMIKSFRKIRHCEYETINTFIDYLDLRTLLQCQHFSHVIQLLPMIENVTREQINQIMRNEKHASWLLQYLNTLPNWKRERDTLILIENMNIAKELSELIHLLFKYNNIQSQSYDVISIILKQLRYRGITISEFLEKTKYCSQQPGIPLIEFQEEVKRDVQQVIRLDNLLRKGDNSPTVNEAIFYMVKNYHKGFLDKLMNDKYIKDKISNIKASRSSLYPFGMFKSKKEDDNRFTTNNKYIYKSPGPGQRS